MHRISSGMMARVTQRSGAIRAGLALGAVLVLNACEGSQGGATGDLPNLACSIPTELLLDGGPGKDGIPALTNPEFVTPDAPGAGYLLDDDRVIGLLFGDEALAVPLNVGWWHEVVNLDLAGQSVSVTHCPLTGSSLVFDRSGASGATFGVSGLLFLNNLVMYDRTEPSSLWPQMLRGARCGRRDGTALAMLPALEMTWGGWRSLFPETKVVSSATGHTRDYRLYPYGDYDVPTNGALLFPITTIDPRRPPKERVLGVPQGEGGGISFPFGSLDQLGAIAAVPFDLAGRRAVVFWDRARQAAMAFGAAAGGQDLTFTVSDGVVVDAETGSAWRIDGVAASGPLAGTRLEPIGEAFVAYWFAWAAFYPEATLWTGS